MTPKKQDGIYERLDEIVQLLNDMKAANAVCEERLKQVEDKTAKHHEAIKGNGKIGLEERAALMEAQLTQIRWIGGAMVLMVIGDIVTRLLSLV